MRCRLICVAVMLVAAADVFAQQDLNETTVTPAEAYRGLLDESKSGGRPRDLAGKFLELAKHAPQDPVAVDALLWVATNVRRGDELTEAIELLASGHATSDKLGPLLEQLPRSPSSAAGQLLRKALEKNPSRDVKAQACFYLIAYLNQQISIRRSLDEDASALRRVAQFYGKNYARHLASLDETKTSQEIERLYEQMLKSFPDAEISGAKLGDVASKELFILRNLSVGRVAPEIVGEDVDGETFKLSDYRGKVVVLSFWGHW